MYGTIAKLNVKSGQVEALKQAIAEIDQRTPPGYIASYVYQMDSNPEELYLTVVFEDEQSYRANAESEEQNQQFQTMMQFMESEPEWHDGEIIYVNQV